MTWTAFKLSLLVVSVATVLVALCGTACGYLLAKRRFPGRHLLDSLLTLPMVLPPTVTGYYLILLLGRRGILGEIIHNLTGWNLTFTWQGAALAAFVVSLPLMVKSAQAAIGSVDARYETVSYTFGKSRMETFFRVTLPLAQRGLLAGLVLSFARALGEFGATMMVAGNIPGRTQTMPLAIYEAVLSGADRTAMILALILTATSVAVIYLASRLTRGDRTE